MSMSPSLRRRYLHDPYLIGNGRWCSCCFPDGAPLSDDWRFQVRPGCNECCGFGRVILTAEEIVATAVAAKRVAGARAA